MKFGLDRLLEEPALRRPLGPPRRAARASGIGDARSRALARCARRARRSSISAAFGPQHGLRGDKQDNMVESPDFTDPVHGIPVFSLYGEVRRPTAAMMDSFDVLLVDLQDLGCRIYTFITTLRYVLEEAARTRQERSGCSIVPIRSAARSRVCACAPAGRASSAPARCRCVTDSRWASWRAGSSQRCALDVDYRRRRDGGLAARRRARVTAGRSASAPG